VGGLILCAIWWNFVHNFGGTLYAILCVICLHFSWLFGDRLSGNVNLKGLHHCRSDLTTHGEKETEQRKESARCSNPFPNQLPPSSCPYYPITSSTTLPCHKQSSYEKDNAKTVCPHSKRPNCSDPKLKHLTCRRCSALLSPRVGSTITRLAETSRQDNDMLEIECCHCGTKRRFGMKEGFSLYSERETAEAAQAPPAAAT
jgi:RNase P subunit RPR2